jgi:UDP-2,3-diacylglucosamine hydrolase
VKYGKIALIAGAGELPVIFLKEAVKSGQDVFVIEVEGEENSGLKVFPFERIKVKLAHLSDMIKEITMRSIKYGMFLGYVKPGHLIKDILFDEITRKVFLSLTDRRAKPLMESAIAEFTNNGITVIPTTYLMDEALAPAGFIGSVKTKEGDIESLKFAVDVAKLAADNEIGQTLVTGSGMIWAVEAMEGTDKCIKRGGAMAGKGFVVVKMARSNQDMRYDVPAMGVKTLKLIKSLGGKGIIIETEKTFMLNRKDVIKYADSNNLFIYGWRIRK